MKQYRDLRGVMDAGDHFKNGASLKSLTSRDKSRKVKSKNFIFSMIVINILLLSPIIRAQITLEHTFPSTSSYTNYDNGLILVSYLNYYTNYSTETNQVRIYNEDYSLYKSITITPPANCSFGGASMFSKAIVTTDDKISFFVTFTNPNETDLNLRSNLRLYNEDGVMLKDFGYSYLFSPTIHLISSGKYRLSLLRGKSVNPSISYDTEIYSLPGNPSTGTASPRASEFQHPYPNPANAIITLPYQLKQGEMSVMHIYNINGQLIETKNIDSVFDKIMLNVSNYSKGIYLYEVNGISNKFIIN